MQGHTADVNKLHSTILISVPVSSKEPTLQTRVISVWSPRTLLNVFAVSADTAQNFVFLVILVTGHIPFSLHTCHFFHFAESGHLYDMWKCRVHWKARGDSVPAVWPRCVRCGGHWRPIALWASARRSRRNVWAERNGDLFHSRKYAEGKSVNTVIPAPQYFTIG